MSVELLNKIMDMTHFTNEQALKVRKYMRKRFTDGLVTANMYYSVLDHVNVHTKGVM